MSRARAVGELLKAVGRAIFGRPAPAPIPAPNPVPVPRPVPPPPTPRPVPAPPVPHPAPGTGTDPIPAPVPRRDATTEDQSAAQADTDQECANCENCLPRQQGSAVARPAPQGRAEQKRGYDYQHFVCPWHDYQPSASLIEEWQFSTVDFDGLHPAECLLLETKHGYDGFLKDSYARTERWEYGSPQLHDWALRADIQRTVFDPMIRQGRRQHGAVMPHYGDVSLKWVFSHPRTSLYVGAMFLENIPGWYHEMEVRPFV